MTVCEFRVLRQADSLCSNGVATVGATLALHEPDAG